MSSKNKNYAITVALCLGLTLAASADIKVGGTFPDLATQKLEGKLPDSTKDKVVMIDFWASWCGPCGESFPVMDELQKKYGPRGLVIIAVSVDEKKSDMDDFLKSRDRNDAKFLLSRPGRQGGLCPQRLSRFGHPETI